MLNMSPNGATADFPSQRLHCLAGIQNMRRNPSPDNASGFLPNRTARLGGSAKSPGRDFLMDYDKDKTGHFERGCS